jgi:threonine/homoserine/homoserine lactone efflux protein
MDLAQLALYFAAAFVLAVTPGPGIFYVAARTLAVPIRRVAPTGPG